MGKICPKCGYERSEQNDFEFPDYECPKCGIVYEKFMAKQKRENNEIGASAKLIARHERKKAFERSVSDRKIESMINDDMDSIGGWRPVNYLLELDYVDENNVLTNRVVAIKRFARFAGKFYLKGFCELRREVRVFRADRVKKCIDLKTGEIIKSIPNYFSEKTVDSAERQSQLVAYAEMGRYKTNHILHLLLSLITVGAWLIVWCALSFINTSHRNKIRRDSGLPTEINWIGYLLGFVIFSIFLGSLLAN